MGHFSTNRVKANCARIQIECMRINALAATRVTVIELLLMPEPIDLNVREDQLSRVDNYALKTV